MTKKKTKKKLFTKRMAETVVLLDNTKRHQERHLHGDSTGKRRSLLFLVSPNEASLELTNRVRQ